MVRKLTEWWMPLAALVAFVGVGFGASVARSQPGPRYADTTSGGERQLVFIGSSSCGYANAPEMPALFEQIRRIVERSAVADGRRFVTVGIARDTDVGAGLAHLKKFGQFDELLVGRSWVNTGTLKYVFGVMRGTAATPQVLVVDRLVHTEGGAFAISNEVLVKRRSGLVELREWASGSGDPVATAGDGPLPALGTPASGPGR